MSHAKNRSAVIVLYRAGLRASEALDLVPKDLDCDRGTITVLHGKGDRSRTVALEPSDVALVERWLERRRKLGLSSRQPLFCSLNGKRLSAGYVRTMLPRLRRRAGIEKRVHAHGLRHSLAYELHVTQRQPVNVVQAILGHSSLATTSRYLAHIAPAQVIDVMRNRPPFDV
jgi:site-specific recombinase XerD